MINNRKYAAAGALGSLTAAVALLVGMAGAQAQAPAPSAPLQGAGSFPGSFIVPGTNTSLHVGGVVELDMSYDMDESDGSTSPGGHDNSYPQATGVHGAGVAVSTATNQHGIFRMTDQFTRPNFETRTPTPYGEVKTYIEIDFSGSVSAGGLGSVPAVAGPPTGNGGTTQTACCGNFSVARIKQAYGTLGPWLFGMTNSTFSDLAAWPDSIDGGGDAGGYMFNALRYQPQVRYTYLLPNGISLAAAIESFQSSGLISATATATGAAAVGTPSGLAGAVFAYNNFDEPGYGEKYPALVGAAQIDQPWGHAAFHVAIAQERLVNQITGGAFGLGTGFPQGQHVARWGYMLSQTGHFNTWGKDKVTWQLVYGQGAANYTGALAEVGTQWEEGLVCSVTNATATPSYACSQPRVVGVSGGYSHWWTDEWRSGISAGYDAVSRPNAAGNWVQPSTATASGLGVIEKRALSAHANLLWTPVPQVQLGIEYQWYHRVVQSGAQGSHQRIATQAIFKF